MRTEKGPTDLKCNNCMLPAVREEGLITTTLPSFCLHIYTVYINKHVCACVCNNNFTVILHDTITGCLKDMQIWLFEYLIIKAIPTEG